MKNKNLYIIFGIIFLLYAFQPTPFCQDISKEKLTNEKPDTSTSQNKVNDLKQELSEFKYMIVNTFGESMFPTLKENQACGCFKSNNYSIDDIIVYYAEGTNNLIGHRIIAETKNGFITKGDNNNWADGEINDDNILCNIPYVRRHQLWNKN